MIIKIVQNFIKDDNIEQFWRNVRARVFAYENRLFILPETRLLNGCIRDINTDISSIPRCSKSCLKNSLPASNVQNRAGGLEILYVPHNDTIMTYFFAVRQIVPPLAEIPQLPVLQPNRDVTIVPPYYNKKNYK